MAEMNSRSALICDVYLTENYQDLKDNNEQYLTWMIMEQYIDL
jgi:hypothetical protein